MTPSIWWDFIICAGIFFLMYLTWIMCKVAHINGVIAGYGHARDPRDARYADAGKLLKEYCKECWPELGEEE